MQIQRQWPQSISLTQIILNRTYLSHTDSTVRYKYLPLMLGWSLCTGDRHTVHHIGWMQNIWQQFICYSQIHTNEPHYASAYKATSHRRVLYIILHVLGNTDMKICNQITNQWPSQSKRSQLHQAGCVPGRCKLLNPQGRHPTGQGQHSQSHTQVGTGDLAEKKIFQQFVTNKKIYIIHTKF